MLSRVNGSSVDTTLGFAIPFFYDASINANTVGVLSVRALTIKFIVSKCWRLKIICICFPSELTMDAHSERMVRLLFYLTISERDNLSERYSSLFYVWGLLVIKNKWMSIVIFPTKTFDDNDRFGYNYVISAYSGWC